ncbi:glycosyl transferase, WecB/TagA/CpsF family, partial [human gut metagenome]
MDIIRSRRYRMIFMGTSQAILDGLKENLIHENPDVAQMQFVELPFRKVEEFDYPEIARMVEADGADIIWVALGAPKQEIFMSRLKPYLHHGVMIAVGAAFKFFSGTEVSRATPVDDPLPPGVRPPDLQGAPQTVGAVLGHHRVAAPPAVAGAP